MMLYRAAREEWEQQLRDLRLAAKVKAKQQQQEQQKGHRDQQQQSVRRVLPSGEGAGEASASAGASAIPEVTSLKWTAASEGKSSSSKKQRGSASKSGSGIAADVEVVIAGADAIGDDSDSDGDGGDGGNDANSLGSSEGGDSVSDQPAGKRRKVSSRGKVAARSNKHYKAVDAKLAAAKALRLQLTEGASPAAGNGKKGGMFAADVKAVAVAASAALSASKEGAEGRGLVVVGAGEKARSIAEVDRAMRGGEGRSLKRKFK
jgi:hypothetical protein